MKLTISPRAGCGFVVLLLLSSSAPAWAETIQAVHRFTDTGTTQSQYGLGAEPYSEMMQASDGNFYGTTVLGGGGLCLNTGNGNVEGCGTIFRMTSQGVVTVLFSFPYNKTSGLAPDGAFPTAGLIQGQDGYLYGVAQDGGLRGCNGALGCGTLFRISTAGAFTLLHKFCSGDGCSNPTEGGRPMAHLVQKPGGELCGTTAQGGFENEGTLFCATTSGGVNTLYTFEYENGTDGYDPVTALLVGPDGATLYGTTVFGGSNGGSAGGGIVFAFRGSVMTVLHNFDNYHSGTAGTYYEPEGALIFGADGKLYGTTYSGGNGGGCIFSLNTNGTGFVARHDFNANASSSAPGFPVAGLVLARDGMMYGTTLFGSLEQTFGLDSGIAYRFDPTHGTFTELADFNSTFGAMPRAALIEGADKHLYGTASLYGGSNARGQDAGSVVRLAPALQQ